MTDPFAMFAAARPSAVLLEGPEGVLTYGAALSAIDRRSPPGDGPITIAPRRDFESILSLLAAIRSGRPVAVVDPDDPRPPPTIGGALESEIVVYTSGAAGGRKGVRLTAANWQASTRATNQHIDLTESDRWLLVLPLHHVGGLSVLYRCIAAGASIILHPSFDPARVASDLAGRATIASLVPVMLERVLDSHAGPYPSTRWLLVGGGPAAPQLFEKARAAGLAAVPSYGMTETAAQIACGRPGDDRLFPLSGVELRIALEGAIEVRGEMVAAGYLGGPELPPGGFFTTGDRGTLEEDGELRVLGRLDRVIVSGGESVDPEEVEAVLSTIPDIGEVAVIGLPDRSWGAVVGMAFTGPTGVSEVEEIARDLLPAGHRPRRFLRVDRLPRNEMGKVDLVALRSMFA
jgi:O-succinylbenzoic acid--CoA ligase